MGYSFAEQETTLTFDNVDKQWIFYSACPRHIKKLMEISDDYQVLELEDDRPIAIRGILKEKQISMRLLRVLSEDQRKKIAERLHKSKLN